MMLRPYGVRNRYSVPSWYVAGNVGIGINPPIPQTVGARVLHIDGGADNAQVRLTNTATGSAASNGSILNLIGSDLFLWNFENAYLSLGTNVIERVRIAADGVTQHLGISCMALTAPNNMTIPAGYGTVVPGPYDAATFTIDLGVGSVMDIT